MNEKNKYLTYTTDEEVLNYLMNTIKEVDTKINTLKLQIQRYILSSIDKELFVSDGNLPLVANDDYAKIKEIRSTLKEEINVHNKILELSSDEEEKANAKTELGLLLNNLEMLEENPNEYLRYEEAFNFDYTNVTDEEKRANIKDMIEELKTYQKLRNDYSSRINKLEMQVQKAENKVK